MAIKKQKVLSARQRNFIKYFFREGLSPAEAYRKAYDKPDKPREYCVSEASRIMRLSQVSSYLKKLESAQRRNMILTKKQRQEKLTEIIMTPLSQMDEDNPLLEEFSVSETATGTRTKKKKPSIIGAIQELNRMDGAYEPEKVEVTGGINLQEIIRKVQQTELV